MNALDAFDLASGDAPFRMSDLAGLPVPEREWHVAELVPARTVTMLGGDGGVGKSILALQLSVATVTPGGGRWLGREVREGRCVYLSAEDDRDELHRRLADIAAAHGVALADGGALTLRSLAGGGALLAETSRTGRLVPTPLFDEVEGMVAASQPALVTLDTLSDLHDGNENDRATARHFIGLLRGLAIRHGCAVLLLAHPSLAGLSSGSGLSGSTGWNNSVRSRLYLDRVLTEGYEADPARRVLRTVKSNYAPKGGEICMTWRAGVFVADAAGTSLDRLAANAKAERVFLKLLDVFTERGLRLNPVSGPTFAPARFAEHGEAEGVSKRGFKAAMESLFGQGKLAVQHEGPPSKRVAYIARLTE